MPRILVVDDDTPSQDFLRMALTEEGYEVASAYDGNEGLEQVTTFLPDLILLDLYMPIINGEMFLEMYHDMTGHKVPIIALSATGRSAARAMQLAGVEDFLIKPFNLDDLLNCIEKHLKTAAI
jgi:DNA-binding response OmpR family regulator